MNRFTFPPALRRRPEPRRRGFSLMIAIVLLAVAAGLLLAAAKTAAVHRRSLEPNQAAVQADLLADAGARLAALAAEPVGELPDAWTPALPGGTASVTFSPAASGDGPPQVDALIERDGVTARARRVVLGAASSSPASSAPTSPSSAGRVPLLAPKPAPRSDDAN